jgi:hypothetical protein
VCHFQVKLKAAYYTYVGPNIACLKTVGALTPLLLAVGALASSLPYSDTAQTGPAADLSALQNEWADHLASTPQDADLHEAWRNAKEHISKAKTGDHRPDRGTSPTASSTDASTTSNAVTGDVSILWTGRGLDFQQPSSLSNYASPRGDTWENLGGSWPDGQKENQNLNVFRGFHTMLRDTPTSFDPLEPGPAPTPEPVYTVFLLAGPFAAALFFARRFRREV